MLQVAYLDGDSIPEKTTRHGVRLSRAAICFRLRPSDGGAAFCCWSRLYGRRRPFQARGHQDLAFENVGPRGGLRCFRRLRKHHGAHQRAWFVHPPRKQHLCARSRAKRGRRSQFAQRPHRPRNLRVCRVVDHGHHRRGHGRNGQAHIVGGSGILYRRLSSRAGHPEGQHKDPARIRDGGFRYSWAHNRSSKPREQ